MTDIVASPQPDTTPEEMSSSGQDGGAPPPMAAAPPDAGQSQPAPQQPPVQVMAAHPKAHIFSSLLNVLGGGNKTEYSVDPQTGTMQTISVPQTKGTLAKSIIAGALTGLLGGSEQRPQPGREISQGIMRGAGAVQQKTAQQSQQAQQTATDDYNRQQQQKVRQMQTVEANMRMYALAQDIGRKDKEFQDSMGSQEAIDSYENQGMLVNDNASGQEAMDSSKYPHDRYIVVPKPKSSYPRTNSEGKPVYRTPDGDITTDPGKNNIPLYNIRYAIADSKAQTPIREMASEQTGANTTVKTPGPLLPWVKEAQFYTYGGPQFANADNLGNTMSSPVASTLQHQVAGATSMAEELDDFAKKTGQTWTDKEGNTLDAKHYLRQQIIDNPSLKGAIDQWTRTAAGGSTEPDLQILDKMGTDPKALSARGDLMKLFGGRDKLEQYKEAREFRIAGGKTGAEEAERVKAETTPEAVAAAARKEREVTKARVAEETSPTAILGASNKAGAETKARDIAHEAAIQNLAHNPDGSWNPNSIPVALVDADMDPSQLSKRSKDYDANLTSARTYSMQKYGKKFDIEQAQADYKYANTPQTQATLKYLNSLTGVNNTGGNLQALIDASDKINRTRFPALNDVAAWTRLETGDPGITALKATAVETADQAAKILQGGGTGSGTSDAKLKQAVELFNTGFSKDQIKSSAGALRGLLGNRKKEMIGDNRYLLKQYSGGWSPANQGGGGASPAPEGTIVTVNGKQMIKQGGQWVAH